MGLTMDLALQPDKVLKACEALMPHLHHVASSTADGEHQVPIGFWMHRGGVPFVTPDQFKSHYWPTLKPIIEELWKEGHQTLFYAEGDWIHHLDNFAELPDRSIVYHVDNSDIFETHKKLGHKFCLSGGVPNALLGYGTEDEVRDYAKKIIDGVAKEGGYIMDASAIMQNDTKIENLKALTDFTRDYGVYSSGSSKPLKDLNQIKPSQDMKFSANYGMPVPYSGKVKPGICRPWEEKVKEIPEIRGDEKILRDIWEDNEAFGNMFIWQCLLSF